ncbi:MAG: hypothetical protein HAW67_06970 [Endozoicomonadaceae bacterium]|nr:hypothetical protein [Endozoicomonadaceae bacterium]
MKKQINPKSSYRGFNRRSLFKLPLLLFGGGTALSLSKTVKADPFKIIADVMAMVVVQVQDQVMAQVMDFENLLSDQGASKSTESKGKVGDAINQSKANIANNRLKHDSEPSPDACNLDNKAHFSKSKVRQSQRAIEKLNQDRYGSNRFVSDVVNGDDHDFGRNLQNFLVDKQYLSNSTTRIRSNIITINTIGLLKDGAKFVNEHEKKAYKDNLEIMNGPNLLSKTVTKGNDLLSKKNRHHYAQKLAITAIANSYFISEFDIIESEERQAYKKELEKTYYNSEWRTKTQALASPVPNGINLINQSATKLELLFAYLQQLDNTILLKAGLLAADTRVKGARGTYDERR